MVVCGAGKPSNQWVRAWPQPRRCDRETGNSDAANAASLAFRLGMADPPPSRDLPTIIIAMEVQLTPSGTIGQNMSGLTRCAPQAGWSARGQRDIIIRFSRV